MLRRVRNCLRIIIIIGRFELIQSATNIYNVEKHLFAPTDDLWVLATFMSPGTQQFTQLIKTSELVLSVYHCRKVDASFVFTSKSDIWWRLIQAQPEAFQLMFKDLFVLQWLQNVKYHEYQAASASHYKYTAHTTL